MNKTVIKGFVSVKSVLEAKSREIYRIIIDRDRYDSVMASDLRVPERRQYEKLIASGAEIQFVSKDDFSELVSSEGAGGIAAEAGERIFTDAAEVISVRDGYIAVLDVLRTRLISHMRSVRFTPRASTALFCRNGISLPQATSLSVRQPALRN